MATAPRIDNTGALALKPPRVNIFAKPDSGEGERAPSGTQPRGIFDAAAACEGLVAEPAAGPSSQGVRRHGTSAPTRWAARLVALTAVGALIAALATQPRPERAVDRSAPPAQRPDEVRASDRPERRLPAADATTRHQPARKRAKPHRATRPRRTSRGGPRAPHPPLVPIAPRVTPRRPAPRSAAPAGPLPAPVAPDAPPEFM